MRLPARPQKVALTRRAGAVLGEPVVTGNSVFAGDEGRDILRLDRPRYEPVWSTPAQGFEAGAAFPGLIRLDSWQGSHFKGLRDSGEVVWTLTVTPGVQTGWAAAGEYLYSFDPGIFKADVMTGAVVDHYDVPGPPIDPIAICHGIYFLGARKDRWGPVRAFDLRSRMILWESTLRRTFVERAEGVEHLSATSVGMHAGSADELAVVLCGRSLFGFRIRENRIMWQRNFDMASVPQMRGGTVCFWAYATRESANGNNRLVSLDQSTGETIYDVSLTRYGAELAWMQFPIAGTDTDHIAFGCRSGLLAVFRRSDGELHWSHKHSAPVYRPVLWEHGLLVTCDHGDLLIFERTD